MPSFDNAPENATNLVSQALNELLAAEAKRICRGRWNEDNKEAIAAYNVRVAKEGLPLAKYRTFARSLENGKKD